MNIKNVLIKVFYFLLIFFVLYFVLGIIRKEFTEMKTSIDSKIEESRVVQEKYQLKLDSLKMYSEQLSTDIFLMNNNIKDSKKAITNLKPPKVINYTEEEALIFLRNFSNRYNNYDTLNN